MAKESSLRIEGVFPADIVVRLLISAKSLDKLLDYLSAATLDYDGEKQPKLKKAAIFVTEEFFPLLNSLNEEIKGGDYGS